MCVCVLWFRPSSDSGTMGIDGRQAAGGYWVGTGHRNSGHNGGLPVQGVERGKCGEREVWREGGCGKREGVERGRCGEREGALGVEA